MAASQCSCGCQTPIPQTTAGKPNLHYPIEYRPPEPPPLLSLGNSPDITLTSYLSPSHSHLIYSPPQSSNIHTAEFCASYMHTPSFTLSCHTTLSSGQPYYALELANPITTPTLSQIPERKYVSCDEKVNGDACESVSFKGCGDACVGDRDKLQMESQLKPGVAVVGTVGRNDQADTSKLVKEAVEIHGELIVDAVEVEPQVFDKSLKTLKLNLDASNDIRQQSEVSSDLVSEFPQTPTHVSTIVFAAPLMFDESPERVRKVVLLPIATGEVKSGNNVIVASELGVENDGDGAVRESILGGNIFFKGSGDACDKDDGFSLFTEAEESVKEVGSDGGEENTMGYEPWNREWDWDDESDVEIETEVGNGDVSGEDGNEIEGDAPEEFFEVEEIFSSMDTQIGKGDLDTHIAGKDVVRGSKLNDDNDSVVWIEDLETHPFLDCALDDGTPKPNTSDDGFPKPDTSGNFDEVKVDNRVDEIYSTELAHDVSLVTDTMIVNGDDRSAVEAVVSANEELVKLHEEVATLLKSSSAAGEDEDVDSTGGLTELYEKLQVMGSDAAEAQAARILAGLGFTKEMQSRPTRSFSGGWRMRISLARALFVQPTLLSLDEPTNHLDLRAVLWLKEYICQWKKTLVVSHDRDFLNTVCDEIIHLHDLQLHFYSGNYDEFETGYEQRRKEKNKKYDKVFKLPAEQSILKVGKGKAAQRISGFTTLDIRPQEPLWIFDPGGDTFDSHP